MNLIIEAIGGWCPVQAEGTVNGIPFYFRARGARWKMCIGTEPIDISLGWAKGWCKSEEFGEGPYDAGYMALDIAEGIIVKCADEFMAGK